MTDVSPDAVAAYRRDGVVALRSVFDATWIDQLRRGLEKNMDAPGPYRREYGDDGTGGRFFGDYCNWQRISEYESFVRQSPAAGIAKQLMDSQKTNFFHEHVVVKAPGADEPTPWHHDHPYYCLDGFETCSLWIPLDDVPRDSTVEFIAGSHQWGRLFQPRMFVVEDYPPSADGFEIMPDIDGHRDDYEILSFDLEPGDCAAFHFRTVHGAPGNQSSLNARRAIAYRWTGDDITFQRRAGVMSPPFPEFSKFCLKPGDPLDSDLFPIIE